ncbi:MAG: hypothetical protein ANABAC_1280 [Anaerolineae bacterium]|nr:MAG: hypothetical protein ANABAC_1280 [Anaerolineae bacterium]
MTSPCPHRHVVEITTGGWHFSEGEAWDDISTKLICLDCGEEILEKAADPTETTPATPEDPPF